MKTLLIASFFSTMFAFAVMGCDEADEALDCAQFCNTYNDCVDGDTDVSACIDECEDIADQNDNAADQADECESCIDSDASCAENVFSCTDDCALFIPATN
jgi:hypothetical protein